MSLNDRLALELGRALLRAVTAEARLAEAQAKLAEAETPAEPETKTVGTGIENMSTSDTPPSKETNDD